MAKGAGIIIACVLAAMMSGCLQVHRPVVPTELLSSSDHNWVSVAGAVEGERGFAPKSVETEYRHEPSDNSESYPAIMVLVGLRSVTRISGETLLDAARDILDEEMEAQGVQAETVSELSGTRTIQSGASTVWLTMKGDAQSNSILFADAREIRVLAEAWYDDSSNMHVVAIAIAQTGGTGIFGNARTDLAVWNELVGDDAGTIDGAKHTEGFIDHVNVQN